MIRSTLALLTLVLVLGATSARAEPARGWEYEVDVTADLKALDVTVRFRQFIPKRLVLGRPDGLEAITVLDRAGGGPGFRANPHRDGILPILGADGSFRYRVDLVRLAALRQAEIDTRRVGRDLLARPGLCLLAPALWPEDADVGLRFGLPDGVRAAVAWPRDVRPGGTRYRLSRFALGAQTRMAFGRFTPDVIEVGGATLEVVVLDARHRVTRAGIRRWIGGAARAVTGLFGAFPVRHACLIVYPLAPGRGRPVTFGRALRAGGAIVDLAISPVATDDEFVGEWMTVHELTHLGMPWNDTAGRWWSEGFVAYYQEVLRARMGWISERDAWQRMESWMDRGRSSGGRETLRGDSIRMTGGYAYHRVYYGGAAIALLIDTELRRRSNGTRSFDDVMRILHKDLAAEGREIDGLSLMREVDRRLGESICAPIAGRWLGSRSFPDTRGAQRALGIRVNRGTVTLDDRAPRAADRRAIMGVAAGSR